MQGYAMLENFQRTRYLFFKWRYGSTLVEKIALGFGLACVTGLAAQVRIPLPWTPVPITGQTFAVLLAGVLLGRWWGGISQAIYVSMGMAGVPWFAGWSGGYSAVIGPTGGYIVGFIFAALFVGHFTDKYIKARGFLSLLAIMIFANFLLIHFPGLFQLGLWLHLVKGTTPTLWDLLLMGTIPFVIGDMTKILLAAGMARAITPREAYNGEVDVEKEKRCLIS